MKTKPKNIRQARYLIRRYRKQTIESINNAFGQLNKSGELVFIRGRTARKLTGFGDTKICILCKDSTWRFFGSCSNCEKCIYKILTNDGCNVGINEKTYDAIKEAKTPKGLLRAFKNRADHIEKILKNYAEGVD